MKNGNDDLDGMMVEGAPCRDRNRTLYCLLAVVWLFGLLCGVCITTGIRVAR